jgi:hypothetical protein
MNPNSAPKLTIVVNNSCDWRGQTNRQVNPGIERIIVQAPDAVNVRREAERAVARHAEQQPG